VQAALTAVKPLGTGQLIVQAAGIYNEVITAILKGDGTNPNLAANAASALSALGSLNLIGPWYITAQLVIDLLRGNVPPPTLAILTPTGPVDVAVPTGLFPGFTGCAAVTALSSSNGGLSLSLTSQDVVPNNYVLVMGTSSITVA
jgi:hypothetical protein